MTQQELEGGMVWSARDVVPEEYLPNKGVFLAQMLGKARGDGLGLYFGRMEPGCAISREIHEGTAETIFILSGRAMGLLGETEVPLEPGQVLHANRNVPHGLRNVGEDTLEFLVIGQPDF